MALERYVSQINEHLRSGEVSERTFKGDLRALIEGLIPEVSVTQLPQTPPDLGSVYTIKKRDRQIASIEVERCDFHEGEGPRSTGAHLRLEGDRSARLPVIKTDYLHFEFYREGQLIAQVSIAEVTDEGVSALSENISLFAALITRCCAEVEPEVKSPQKLAALMAGHARLLAALIEGVSLFAVVVTLLIATG